LGPRRFELSAMDGESWTPRRLVLQVRVRPRPQQPHDVERSGGMSNCSAVADRLSRLPGVSDLLTGPISVVDVSTWGQCSSFACNMPLVSRVLPPRRCAGTECSEAECCTISASALNRLPSALQLQVGLVTLLLILLSVALCRRRRSGASSAPVEARCGEAVPCRYEDLFRAIRSTDLEHCGVE